MRCRRLVWVGCALSLGACSPNAAGRVPGSGNKSHEDPEDVSPQSKRFYETAVRGVVGCYEAMGEDMPREYDESGACPGLGTDSNGSPKSIWTTGSTNATLAIRARAEYDASDNGARGANVYGDYGFETPTKVCTGSVSLKWTEEDASLEFVKAPYCVTFSQMKYASFGIAMGIARARGMWAERSCMERGYDAPAGRETDYAYPVSYTVPFFPNREAAQGSCSWATDRVTVYLGTNADAPTEVLSASVDATKAQVDLTTRDLDYRAFGIAMAVGRARGSWVDRRCLAEPWANGNTMTYTMPFGEKEFPDDDGEPGEVEGWCPDPHYGVEITFIKNDDGTVWLSGVTVIDA